MKNMSKITALMLALLLALGMLLPAYAGSVADVDIDTWNTWLEDLKVKFPEMSVEEQYQYIMQLDDSAKLLLIDTLSQEQYIELSTYAASMEGSVEVNSVTFTQAAPFLPAVTVNSIQRMKLYATRNSGLVDNEAIVTSKILSSDGKTLRLESYVTGKTTVTTVTKSTPVDIVLVLDQSGSMAYDFNGDSTNTIANRRQYAMRNAVNNFIDAVAEKYSEECDNRMAIVTFGSSASTLQGWTLVNENGQTSLKQSVSGLPDAPSGATNVAAGMQTAETLLGSGYSYSGSNTTRQKVVIVFTDGVPTTSSEFSTSVATNAIASAKNLKDNGVTVYSIGIFNGVNPNQLYGDKVDNQFSADEPCTGEVGSRWGASVLTQLFGDVREIDIAAGNRFLNYLSSNFATATEIGITGFSGLKSGWSITKNFDRTATGYYLTATDAASLNTIFQTISSNIQSGTASVQLDSNTVVKDVISDYFTLPTDADGNVITSGIKVYTALYKQDGTWGEDTPSALVPTVTGNTVTVTGFDFSKNYCSTDNGRQDGNNDATGNFYGRKLIIEIPIEEKDAFLGGNGVPTNTTDSGIYAQDGTLMEQFDVPEKDVPVKVIVTVTDPSKNVYVNDSLTKEELLTDAVVEVKKDDGSVIELKMDETNFGLETWQNAYVNIETAFTKADNTAVGTETGPLVNDEPYTYKLTATITPTTSGSAEKTTGNVDVKVYVYKPEFTFQDTEVEFYVDELDVSNYFDDENYCGMVWKHNGTEATAQTEFVKDEPTIVLSYVTDPASGFVDENDIYIHDDDLYVNVNVTLNGTAYEPVFVHKECVHEDCDWPASKCEFIVHVINVSGDLILVKEVVDANGTKLTDDTTTPFTFKIALMDKENKPVTKTYGNVKFVNGVASVDVKVGTPVTIPDIDYGYTYTVSEPAVPTGYLFKEAKQSTGSMTADGNTTTIVNYKTGTLTVTKEVTGSYAPTGTDADSFEFTIGLYNNSTEKTAFEGAFDYAKADGSQITTGTISSGETFELKDGATVTITGIPVGVYYEVSETEHMDYTTTKTGDTGTISTTVSTADFINAFKYTELTITKQWPEETHTYSSGDVESAIVIVSGSGYNFTVALTADKYEAIITGLPIGAELTVTEKTNWTWRYTSTGDKTIKLADSGNEVTIVNTHVNQSWLGGDNYDTNVFN